MDTNIHLKPPRKNYGFLPSNIFIAHTTLFLLSFIVVGFGVFRYATEPELKLNFIFLMWVVAFSIYLRTITSNWRNRQNIIRNSREMRYYQRRVIPFLKKRYGVTPNSKNADELSALFSGEGRVKGRNGSYIIRGVDAIDSTAEGKIGSFDEDAVMLLKVIDHESILELPRADLKSHEPSKYSIVAQKPTLREFETTIELKFAEFVNQAKPGVTHFNVSYPDVSDSENGIQGTFKVAVDDEGLVVYSRQEMKKIIEAMVFGVRMYSQSLLVALRESNENPSVAGVVFTETNYANLSIEEMKNIMNQHKSEFKEDNFSFVAGVEEL